MVVSRGIYVERYRYVCPLILRDRAARIKSVGVSADTPMKVYLSDITGVIIDAETVRSHPGPTATALTNELIWRYASVHPERNRDRIADIQALAVRNPDVVAATHPHEHEVFVVEGQGVFVCEGQEYEFCDKYIIFVLPNEKHQF